jgi:hypothetical protein
MREILRELEQRCESLNSKARNWGELTCNPEVILKLVPFYGVTVRLKGTLLLNEPDVAVTVSE